MKKNILILVLVVSFVSASSFAGNSVDNGSYSYELYNSSQKYTTVQGIIPPPFTRGSYWGAYHPYNHMTNQGNLDGLHWSRRFASSDFNSNGKAKLLCSKCTRDIYVDRGGNLYKGENGPRIADSLGNAYHENTSILYDAKTGNLFYDNGTMAFDNKTGQLFTDENVVIFSKNTHGMLVDYAKNPLYFAPDGTLYYRRNIKTGAELYDGTNPDLYKAFDPKTGEFFDIDGKLIYKNSKPGIAGTGELPDLSNITPFPRAAVLGSLSSIIAIIGVSYAAKSLAKFAMQDNVELEFTINNRSSHSVFYDRNDWKGWGDKIKGYGKDCSSNCRGSLLPGQAATMSIGSKTKGASIGWNIGFNENFSSGQITYARIWKQMNRDGGLDIQSANTPYNVHYSQYASGSADDGITKTISSNNNYLFIANDVSAGVTTNPVFCQLNSNDSDKSDVCSTGVNIYDTTENLPIGLLTYYTDGTNNMEILVDSNFTLYPSLHDEFVEGLKFRLEAA